VVSFISGRSAVLACAIALLMATGRAEASDWWVRSDAIKGEALLVGSSSLNHYFGHLIARELSQRGYRVYRKGVSAAGLARPDFRDMNAILESLPISKQTNAVFVYLGMNDAQSIWLHPNERNRTDREYLPWEDSRWAGIYAGRARDFFQRICQRGAQRAVVILPVDVKKARLQQRLDRIRALQAQAAKDSSCAVAVSTTGDDGRFEVGGHSMRTPDGFHLSRKGAEVVWRRIQDEALLLLGARTSL
jgi:hypothetical protein